MRLEVDYQQHPLQADCIGVVNACELLLLHGAGVSDSSLASRTAQALALINSHAHHSPLASDVATSFRCRLWT